MHLLLARIIELQYRTLERMINSIEAFAYRSCIVIGDHCAYPIGVCTMQLQCRPSAVGDRCTYRVGQSVPRNPNVVLEREVIVARNGSVSLYHAIVNKSWLL